MHFGALLGWFWWVGLYHGTELFVPSLIIIGVVGEMYYMVRYKKAVPGTKVQYRCGLLGGRIKPQKYNLYRGLVQVLQPKKVIARKTAKKHKNGRSSNVRRKNPIPGAHSKKPVPAVPEEEKQ
jgi:hypothetical protein